jgi:hypothetical protein
MPYHPSNEFRPKDAKIVLKDRSGNAFIAKTVPS